MRPSGHHLCPKRRQIVLTLIRSTVEKETRAKLLKVFAISYQLEAAVAIVIGRDAVIVAPIGAGRISYLQYPCFFTRQRSPLLFHHDATSKQTGSENESAWNSSPFFFGGR